MNGFRFEVSGIKQPEGLVNMVIHNYHEDGSDENIVFETSIIGNDLDRKKIKMVLSPNMLYKFIGTLLYIQSQIKAEEGNTNG